MIFYMVTVNVDIISRTSNPYRYIPIINQSSPIKNFPVNESQARQLIQIADLWIKVSANGEVLNGDNFYDYFPNGSGGGGGDGHTHPNLTILNQTTAAYTIEDKRKLAEVVKYQAGTGIDIDDENGIIGNTGVVNISQNDPNHMNVLTIEVNNTTREITIPTNENDIYPVVDDDGLYVLLHDEPDDWSTSWMNYYEKTYDVVSSKPSVFYPTYMYKYENGQFVLGSAGDNWEDCIWYSKHYVSLSPDELVDFESDVYYKSELKLLVSGESMSSMVAKMNVAIEAIERLQMNKAAVKPPGDGSELIEFF